MTGPLEDIHGMIAGEGQISDDLVKRLRANDLDECYEAADRIEALEAQLAEARMQSLSDLGQAQEAYEAQLKAEANYKEAFQMYVDANEARINAEAQLAEAVAALQFYAGPHEYPSEGPWGLNSQDFGAKAAVALHKITKAD